jgi:NAD(P)-dependent dehydrogenase (short-subunit alcohol dehydrogenase family)
MSTPLHGKIALVTGGAKGFGLGIAQKLAAAGARVWITGRDQAALDVAAKGTGLTALRADATSAADWDRVVASVTQAAGRIDILVNNAGGGVKIASTEDQTDEAIDAAIALNLNSVIYGCRRIAPLMRKQGSGIIVNIGSVAGHHAWPTWGVYGAAKAGLNHFSKSLYLELRPHGVRVTTITPSWGATTFTDAAGMGPRDAETLAQCIKPAEIGQLVADVCALPPHLCIQETILWPMVQEVSPL